MGSPLAHVGQGGPRESAAFAGCAGFTIHPTCETISRRFGRGEGRLHVAAALRIDADGHVEVDDYDGVDGTIDRIRQIR